MAMRQVPLLLVLQFLVLMRTSLVTGVEFTKGLCPNTCSGHGLCGYKGYCECYAGYIGVDCSQRICPSHYAWVDYPTANDTAHAPFTECSNMGTCDRTTGTCKCRSGFTGVACEQMMCHYGSTLESVVTMGSAKEICSGSGRCLSLREASTHIDYDTHWGGEEYTGWDADKIHGCVCDVGWEGSLCNRKSCPRGDDPDTPGTNEKQLVDCRCKNCVGGVYFVFGQQVSPLIPVDATKELLKYRLEQFKGIERVEVSMFGHEELCSTVGTLTTIEFVLPTNRRPVLKVIPGGGLKPSLLAVRANGAGSSIFSTVRSVTGTKEYVECSRHGACDYSSGACMCFSGYNSSDGRGNPGTRGDCGWKRTYISPYVTNMVTRYSSCPVVNNKVCSGNGVCDENTGTCTCRNGFDGLACAQKYCGASRAWFGNVGPYHSNYAICGGIGECNYDTGECQNCGGSFGAFSGTTCERLSCVKNNRNKDCNDNGVCLTMRELAKLSYNEQKELRRIEYNAWDADMIAGCACDRVMSVDGRYDPNYMRELFFYQYDPYLTPLNFTYGTLGVNFTSRFLRGPYAHAVSDFTGYVCGQSLCPKGDNPRTGGVNEIQRLRCDATNGSFPLTFRENTTLPIFPNDTLSVLQHKLEQIFTISNVSVTSDDDFVCSNSSVYIEFLGEFGDLPLMRANRLLLESNAFLSLDEWQKGTKEEVECSQLGVCNYATGQCSCIRGYGSSDGVSNAMGERGDCSWYNPLHTATNK